MRINSQNYPMKFVPALSNITLLGWQLKAQSPIVWIGFLLVNQTWQGVGTLAFNWLSQPDRMIGELRGKSAHLGISAEYFPEQQRHLHATACDWTGPCGIFAVMLDLQVLTRNRPARRCSLITACLQICRHLKSILSRLLVSNEVLQMTQ